MTDQEAATDLQQTEDSLRLSGPNAFGRHTFRHRRTGKLQIAVAANRTLALRSISRFPEMFDYLGHEKV